MAKHLRKLQKLENIQLCRSYSALFVLFVVSFSGTCTQLLYTYRFGMSVGLTKGVQEVAQVFEGLTTDFSRSGGRAGEIAVTILSQG